MKITIYKLVNKRIHKSIILTLANLLIITSIFAQTPQKMSYQAVVRDSASALVVNSQVGMRISILQSSASGTVVYTETQTPATNANGLVSIEIGGGAAFGLINWANGPYFIKTETDPTGGTSYNISGVSQLLNVPYALHAKTAETVANGFSHYVGELFGGGIIFSVWKVGGVEHGLIAALANVNTGNHPWTTPAYISTRVPDMAATSYIDGLTNTNAIVAQAGPGTTYAAGLCHAYSAAGDGGLNDWYLPAVWELKELFNASFKVSAILGSTNGFIDTYWSSTEDDEDLANFFTFYGSGDSNYSSKSDIRRVRAIRRF